MNKINIMIKNDRKKCNKTLKIFLPNVIFLNILECLLKEARVKCGVEFLNCGLHFIFFGQL